MENYLTATLKGDLYDFLTVGGRITIAGELQDDLYRIVAGGSVRIFADCVQITRSVKDLVTLSDILMAIVDDARTGRTLLRTDNYTVTEGDLITAANAISDRLQKEIAYELR
jgi:hypothetical protein